jgi:DNA-directed RNA polymerase specialized sigma24 family protein
MSLVERDLIRGRAAAFTVLRRKGVRVHDAEDAAQAAVLRALERDAAGNAPRNVRAWAVRAAMTEVSNARVARERRQLPEWRAAARIKLARCL